MVKKPLQVYKLSNLPPDCAQSGWETQVDFWSAGHPGSLCTTSPLSSTGSLVSSHNSRMAVVGNQDLPGIIKFQGVKQWHTPLTYSAHLFGLFWDSHVERSEKQPDLYLRGRCHWCWSQILCLRWPATPSPWPSSSSFPHPLYSLSQSAIGTWVEECEGGINKATLNIFA